MDTKPTARKKRLPKADRELYRKVIALLERLQLKIVDPDITAEQIAQFDAAFTPHARKLLAYWNAKRLRDNR